MNDFTKEELKQIDFCLYAYPHEEDDYIYEPIRHKIKSMIENYCEHEHDAAFNAIPSIGSPKLCKKCEKFYL